MSRIRAFVRLVFAVGLLLVPAPLIAQQYDPEAPCGRDANGLAYACNLDPSANLEASCLSMADPRYCLPYHQRACQIQGFAVACQLLAIGSNCQGGDPNMCEYYVSILAANRDCSLNGAFAACNWLRQQRF